MFDKILDALKAYADTVWPYVEMAWNAFSDYAYLQAAFLAAVGFLLARLASKHVPEFLKRLVQRPGTELANDIIELTHFPLFNLIFMGGLILSVQVSGFHESVAFALKALLKSAMITVFGIFVFRLARLLLNFYANTGKGRGIIQPQTLPLFTNTALVFVLVGAAQQIFAVWNVDMTALLASAGIAGIAIGMAAQGMLADVIAGILILTDGPYRLNDYIRMGDGVRGKVTRIGIRSTRLITDDHVEIIVPNSVMGTMQILNDSSAKESGRAVKLEITTACGVDPERIRTLLLGIARNHPASLAGADHSVELMGFDRERAWFEFTCWVQDASVLGHMHFNLRESVYKCFLKEEIPLALPALEEVAITHLPDSRQEVSISHLPDSRQEISIKEMPDSSRTLYVKEVPNLFGFGPLKPGPDSREVRNKPLNDKLAKDDKLAKPAQAVKGGV